MLFEIQSLNGLKFRLWTSNKNRMIKQWLSLFDHCDCTGTTAFVTLKFALYKCKQAHDMIHDTIQVVAPASGWHRAYGKRVGYGWYSW